MFILNVIKSTLSSIKSINNETSKVNAGLNSVIISCYNTIVSFIKPFFHENLKYSEIKTHINNIENKRNDKNIPLNNEKIIGVTQKIKADKIDSIALSNAKIKAKSDEIKETIINEIISSLEEIPTLEKKDITKFKEELLFHTKRILFSGNVLSLTEVKNDFLGAIIDSILKSDDKIKYEFGNINTYKYFLLNSINETVSRLLANDKNLVKNGEK
ncbi:hypothetical protein EHQ78_11515 [Proteus mirabilis]|uniref:hypothetical protein n=1 Tax=Proteus mirabilis TaxID=584 RepID=UPI000F5BC29E|nr:hypothetical protein [Proteus mirabilis]AZH06283.1 hypothetical protein EHQ78_11515 [Proteus mirabilis]